MIFYSITGLWYYIRKIVLPISISILCMIIIAVVVIVGFSKTTKWILLRMGQIYRNKEMMEKELKKKDSDEYLEKYLKYGTQTHINEINFKIDNKKQCRVFGIYMNEFKENRKNLKEISAYNYAIMNVFEELLENHNVEIVNVRNEDIAIVCNSIDAEQVYEKILFAKNAVCEIIGIGIVVLKHRKNVEFDEVHNIYSDLMKMKERVFFVGEDAVVELEDEIEKPKENLKEVFDKIVNNIAEGEVEGVNELLNNVKYYKISEGDAKKFAKSLIEQIIQMSNDKNGKTNGCIKKLSDDAMDCIVQGYSWADIVGKLKILFDEVVGVRKSNTDAYKREKYDQIISLVKENYGDCTFCREVIAGEVKLSIKSMEILFKSYENRSVTNYIHEYRMEQARILLLKTTLPVKEIAEMVGYTHISNFIQNFKKRFGATPDKYRRQAE